MTYITAIELWKSLGKNTYTKVRAEAVGTGDGVTSTWSLDHDNVIQTTDTLYTDSTSVGGAYTMDLDDGDVSALTASSDSAITADYSYADIPDSHIQDVLEQTDEFVTSSTGRIFATTTTTEYITVEESAQDEYFLKHWPVSTISSLQVNQNAIVDAPDWDLLTEGIGNDFITNDEDLLAGKFRVIDNFPLIGKDKIKVTYVHGYTTTPYRVKELATLVAQKILMNSAIYQTIYQGRDDSSPINLGVVDERITTLTNELKTQNIEKP